MELTLWVVICFSQWKEKVRKVPGSCRWWLMLLQLSRTGPPHLRLLLLCAPGAAQEEGRSAHRMPKAAPLWEAQPSLAVQPTLWVILGGWGLLSAGKPPVASLPGSFHGWDPSESYCEGEGRSQGTSGLRLSKEEAWREASRWGCKDPASGKAAWVRGSSCPSPCPRASR